MSRQQRKTVAIIGIGRWGKNLVREFSKLADVKYCFHSGNSNNIKWLKEHYPRIHLADSYSRILKDSKVDAIIIATPIKTHLALARRALRTGKHVFLEKPVAQTPKQARTLVVEARRCGRILFIGYVFAYHPVLKVLRQKLSSDKPIYASLEWNKYGTFEEDIRHNLLSHELSIAHLLFGNYKRACLIKSRAIVTNCDVLSVELNFRNFQCDIRINRTANFQQKSVLIVSHKNTWLWEGPRLWRLNHSNYRVSLVFKSKTTPLEYECRAFLLAISNGKKPLTDGSFGLRISELLMDIK